MAWKWWTDIKQKLSLTFWYYFVIIKVPRNPYGYLISCLFKFRMEALIFLLELLFCPWTRQTNNLSRRYRNDCNNSKSNYQSWWWSNSSRWITHSHYCTVSEKVQIILTSYPTGSFFIYGSFTALPTVFRGKVLWKGNGRIPTYIL